MGGGDNGLSRSKVALEAAVESAEGAIGADDRSRDLAESLTGLVVGLERAAAKNFPSGDDVVGRQAKPGAEVLLGGEPGHIRAYF